MSEPQVSSRFNALLAAAYLLADGTTRDMTGVSMDLMRDIAALAAVGGETMKLAADVVVASDAGAPGDEIAASLATLADHIRTYIGREP